ncbi:MAG: hypothetical protein GY941_14915 [Planctomycetes bacterium]|nr:hypothetical protein [Planctomycetota bacterium]
MDVIVTNTPLSITGVVEVPNTLDVNVLNTSLPVSVENNATNPVPVTVTNTLDAQSLTPGDILPPGGRTIAGPGFIADTVIGDDHFLFVQEIKDTPLNLCITINNLSPTDSAIVRMESNLIRAKRMDTQTRCWKVPKHSFIIINDHEMGPEGIVWRIDTYDKF